MKQNKLTAAKKAPILSGPAYDQLGLWNKGRITLFCGHYPDELQKFAEYLACHTASKDTGKVILEIVNYDRGRGQRILSKKPSNLEVFVAGNSDGSAIAHAATSMATCRGDIIIFSTLAPCISDNMIGSIACDSLPWQLIRDEASALKKNLGLVLFSCSGDCRLSHQSIAYANTVFWVTPTEDSWLIECVKSSLWGMGGKRFIIGTQNAIPEMNSQIIKQ